MRFLTNLNSSVTDSYKYDAFGNLIASTGSTPNNYLFASEQFDPALNLYQMRARWYRQATGRFISRDPYEQKSCCGCSTTCGSHVCSVHPSNPYDYADDDPVDRIDPSGKEAVAIPLALPRPRGGRVLLEYLLVTAAVLSAVVVEEPEIRCYLDDEAEIIDPATRVSYKVCYYVCDDGSREVVQGYWGVDCEQEIDKPLPL